MLRGIILSGLLFTLEFAFAAPRVVPPIGEHYPVVEFKKNENPQNILIAYIQLSPSCKLKRVRDGEWVGFYWLMNGTRYKPVHRLIRQGIYQRVREVTVGPDLEEIEVYFKGLERFGENFKNTPLKIAVERNGAACSVQASTLGIDLESVYSHSRKTFVPPFRKVEYIRLSGTLAGRGVERTFKAIR